ncbi:hypothetical protein FIE12Z_3866 [Fusarium flagelliforme]|uniref:F-box domain-containing protein n=1 Tax=Fusarium flagelliforme TaxID=2675880 RepID=A0A395MW81_9HYPO|nr:hypothetical protein FIE12Z_3866 [Fusarium flagelliforme]
MAERRSARLKAKADKSAPAELPSEEPERTSKRKTPPSNNDKLVRKAPKTKSQSEESKDELTGQQLRPKEEHVMKEISQSPVQVSASTSNGLFSSLPPETMNLVLEKIEDKASLGNLGKTCKAFHSLVMPRLYKRVDGSVTFHAHIAKFIRSIEPALTIEQRKQLRKEGQYKGQQETFPDNVDEKRKPEIANFIQQTVFEIGDPGQKHRFIVYRFIEELLESASNLQVFAATDLTEPMAKSLAAKNDLRALHLKVSSERTSDALPLATIKGLRHLHLETSLPYTTEGSPLTLIWNSRSTLRSLVLDKSCFQNFYKNKMDKKEEPNGSSKPQYDFTTLKSLSLKRVSMDPDEVDAITRAIDFTALETKPEHEDPGMKLISSFDTLTSLTVCDAGVHSPEIPNPGLKDALVQAILKHKNLSTLQFTDTMSIRGWKAPYLKAQTVALFIDNLPKLRHLRFYSKAKDLGETAEVLSRGRNLETIRIELPSRSSEKNKEVGNKFICDLVPPILERDSDHDMKIYRWEDHSKIKQVILGIDVWEIGSKLGPFKKGMLKAQKVTSSSDPRRKVMYRDITRPTFLWMGDIFDRVREWVDEVTKDLT